jgi:hypothetical protein
MQEDYEFKTRLGYTMKLIQKKKKKKLIQIVS